jgi:hypothetical protein
MKTSSKKELIISTIISIIGNTLAANWALGMIFLGGLAEGVSSSATTDIWTIIVFFLVCVGCLPVIVNVAFLVFCINRKSKQIWAGWLVGLFIVIIATTCLISIYVFRIASSPCHTIQSCN